MSQKEITAKAGLLIDTNLLLLFIVGTHNRKHIRLTKRTNQFTEQDFEILSRFKKQFKKIFVTPHILTEATNLLDTKMYPTIKELIDSQLIEIYSDSQTVIDDDEACFLKFGLADASIRKIATENILILTDDFRLSSYLINKKLPVYNFNHLRNYFF
jgi:predicted nucleic acid-binding protein